MTKTNPNVTEKEIPTPLLEGITSVNHLVWLPQYKPNLTKATNRLIKLDVGDYFATHHQGNLHIVVNHLIYPIIYQEGQFFLYFGDTAKIPLDKEDLLSLLPQK